MAGLAAAFGRSWEAAQRNWTGLRVMLRDMARIQFGVLAARPAASRDNVGLFYYATDKKELFLSNGTEWSLI